MSRWYSRSIPACAGEPVQLRWPLRESWVYPRVCGGTGTGCGVGGVRGGLSPRVRGNPYHAYCKRPYDGSIPACAGEPQTALPAMVRTGVYPRVCGGTGRVIEYKAVGEGLSPRVRGNPTSPSAPALRSRSIPACAGEPPRCTRGVKIGRVYPRVCGGTVPLVVGVVFVYGLSPRVRGNRIPAFRCLFIWRSIPACAGEPLPISQS